MQTLGTIECPFSKKKKKRMSFLRDCRGQGTCDRFQVLVKDFSVSFSLYVHSVVLRVEI